jgi:hypothetical protein
MFRMSGKSNLGLDLLVKIFGLSLLIIGIILAYYSSLNQSVVGIGASYFIGSGIILGVLGILLLIVKKE